jgi:hypothetical protein
MRLGPGLIGRELSTVLGGRLLHLDQSDDAGLPVREKICTAGRRKDGFPLYSGDDRFNPERTPQGLGVHRRKQSNQIADPLLFGEDS